MSEDRVVAKQRIKDARRAADDLPMPAIQFRGVPIGYFNSPQLIKILGQIMRSYEIERNQFHAMLQHTTSQRTGQSEKVLESAEVL